MTRKQRGRKAWKKWQRLLSEKSRSGQTITAFCRERGLGRQSFFAWRKRLSQAEPKEFLEVKVTKPPTELARGNAAIEVRLKNGRSLIVEPGFDACHVRALLVVLESEA